MSDDRSLIEVARSQQGSERFDYFLLGVTGALCAYVAQTISPEPLGVSAYSLEIVALVILTGSAIAGFKRIETSIHLASLNADKLLDGELRGQLSPPGKAINQVTGETMSEPERVQKLHEIDLRKPCLEQQIRDGLENSLWWYRWRNWLLLFGFVSLLASKIWSGYI